MHQIVLRPNHPDEVYMTGGMGLYRSMDGGENWTHLTERHGFRIGYPDKLIFAPARRPHDVYVRFDGQPGNLDRAAYGERDRACEPRPRRDLGLRT